MAIGGIHDSNTGFPESFREAGMTYDKMFIINLPVILSS